MSENDYKRLLLKMSDMLNEHAEAMEDKEEAFRDIANVCVQMAAFPMSFLGDEDTRMRYQEAALERIPKAMEQYRLFCIKEEAH